MKRASSPPTSTPLPDTLAQRVQVLRQRLDLTIARLAHKAQIDEQVILDIEAGLTLFLSTHTRQMLARALRVTLDCLEVTEQRHTGDKQTGQPLLSSSLMHTGGLTAEAQFALLEAMVNTPDAVFDCPHCQHVLTVQRFIRHDGHGQPIHAIKVRCDKCWFKLDHG
jgi:transcriptional regulator with XRE-family HTH domain